ncbi:MAG: leucine-rich repeat domain-containing protein, partial [Coriobacteriia bacterium]|nr:leucine-rich repeat domain-containing protein [Coriobacteriia bacterium]
MTIFQGMFAKFKTLGLSKKLIAITVSTLLVSLPIFAVANPDAREFVAAQVQEILGLGAPVEIVPASNLCADGWPLPPVWSGTRIPAAYTPLLNSTGGRFDAVNGGFVTTPQAHDPHDFSAFAPVEIPITVSAAQAPGVTQQALFRLDPNTTPPSAELALLPMGASGNFPAGSSATIPSQVTHNGTTYTVVSIGSQVALPGASQPTGWHTVTIPDTVTHIRAEAFLNATVITINMPTAGNLVYIGDRAFAWQQPRSPTTGHSGLTLNPGGRVIPEGVIEVGTQILNRRTESNHNIALPQSLRIVGTQNNFGPFVGPTQINAVITSGAGNNRIIPNDWTQIPPGLFNMNAWSLNGVTFPDHITHIHGYAFNGAADFTTSFNWPSDLEYIGANAFSGAARTLIAAFLVSEFTDFPDGIHTLGDFAFATVQFLPAGTTPYLDFREFPNLTTMGEGVFQGFANVNQAGDSGWAWHNEYSAIPDHWTVIPAFTFANMWNASRTGPAVVDLSGMDVRYIGTGAFQLGAGAPAVNASAGFVEFIPPPNLEHLGARALNNQRNMTGDLIFESGLIYVGSDAFRFGGWDGVLELPQSVNFFGHVRSTWNSIPFPIHRSWIDASFSEIRHSRYVRQMVGSLPSVDDRFDGDVDASWESTLSISDADPILHKQARWTDLHLNEAEIMFQYGALIPWNLAFDLIFV